MTDVIMTSRGKPFSSKTYAEKNLPEGYRAVEDGNGGWIGVKESSQDVICPGCGGRYYETTSEYDPERYANAAMISLKQKYREWGWEDISGDPHSGYGCLVCPECGAALAPSGKLKVENA